MSERQALFISHASPEDNAFTIWLGAKLAAAGYEVWADVLRLKGGDDWQRKLEDGLRNRACKVLLVANQRSVDKQGVRNEIQIASDVARKIGDSRFIIPLRLGIFDTPFLIAHAQYIDFSRGWSAGLHELMSALQDEYKIPLSTEASTEVWSALQAMHGRQLEQRQENLISNWLRVFVSRLVREDNRLESPPSFWLVIIPEIVYELGRPKSRVARADAVTGSVTISKRRAEDLKVSPSLFPDEQQGADVYEYATHFRRQLKARLLKHKIVTQIVPETTLAPEDFKKANGMPLRRLEDPATIAWKLSTGAYHKGGGRPWQLAHVRPGVCYVGLVY